ncbi:zinc ribbon domain-containing protein [Halobacillus halophilus]|uniref:zinc ribbon domain-containing protein n=1 Tax=Halobacillus halophilus TaxID=1570 RepID=UPI00301BB797
MLAHFSFLCEACGEFTIWMTGMKESRREASCPDCQGVSKRVFKPPMTSRMDSRVKQRIENGMEPRTVRREDLPASRPRRQTTARPWQAGH